MKQKHHNKAEEMAILDKAIMDLGPDSYLGPWLTSIRGEVLRDITSDLPPVPTIEDARRAHGAIVADAKNIARGIIQEAERKAKKTEATADNILDTATSALRDALRRLSE